MRQITLIINNEIGLHARPASNLVKETTKFKADIKAKKNDNEGNAKSILAVLSLAVVKGDTVTFTAEGPDEEQAIDVIKNLADHNFGE